MPDHISMPIHHPLLCIHAFELIKAPPLPPWKRSEHETYNLVYGRFEPHASPTEGMRFVNGTTAYPATAAQRARAPVRPNQLVRRSLPTGRT